MDKEKSYFNVTLRDGTEKHERDFNWHDMALNTRVNYMGEKKTVYLCKDDVQKIHIQHEEQSFDLDVPDDCQVYQAVRAETLFTPNIGKTDRVVGRVAGIVKDGEIIEEIFINAMQKSVIGFKK